jgi:transposase
MTRVIIETDNPSTRQHIHSALHTEREVLKRQIFRTQKKIQHFEQQYGPLNREQLYGQIDDLELVEWEGELETLEKLRQNLQSFEEMTFEYR